MTRYYILVCALAYQGALGAPSRDAVQARMTPDTTASALDILWDAAKQRGEVDDYVQGMLMTIKDQCGLRRDPAVPQGAKKARTGADVAMDSLEDALSALKLEDYNHSLDFLSDAMKHVAEGIMQKHNFRFARDLLWHPMAFYIEYCARERKTGTQSVTQRLLDIVDHFPHQPQSGNWYRQRVAWALVEIAPRRIKRQLSVALAAQNYADDPHLVAEIAFQQDAEEEAVFLACAFVGQEYVYPNFFKCGCRRDEACSEGWGNESKRTHCLRNYEIAIRSALACNVPVPDDDDLLFNIN